MKSFPKFDKSELRGIALLLFILGGLIWYRFFSAKQIEKKNIVDAIEFEKEIKEFESSAKKTKKYEFKKEKNNAGKNNKNKVYNSENKKASNKLDSFKIEINTANEKDFEKLKGIGKVLSKRIIKYRNKLGGFYSIKQIKEVYGIKKEIFENIEQYLVCNKSNIKKINVNKASFKELLYHPYLEYDDVKNIFKYRNKNKDKLSKPVLDSILGKEKFEKLKYYVTFE